MSKVCGDHTTRNMHSVGIKSIREFFEIEFKKQWRSRRGEILILEKSFANGRDLFSFVRTFGAWK
jgi:hypothetical protein